MLGDEHATEQHQHNGLRAASGFHGSSIPAHDMGLKAIRQTRMHSAENASDEELTGVNDRVSHTFHRIMVLADTRHSYRCDE